MIYHWRPIQHAETAETLPLLPSVTDWHVTRGSGKLDREHFAEQLRTVEGGLLIIDHLFKEDGWRPVEGEAVKRWAEVLELVREVRPDIRAGVYYNWPLALRQFDDKPDAKKWAEMQARNDTAMPAADTARLVCPSLYAINAADFDSGAWARRSVMVLGEAHRIARRGQQVIPCIAPLWRDTWPDDLIDADRFGQMLDWLIARAHDVAIWSGGEGWQASDPWVREAQHRQRGVPFHVLRFEAPDESDAQKAINKVVEIVTGERGRFGDARPHRRGSIGATGRAVRGQATFDNAADAKAAIDKLKAERGKSPLSQINVTYHRCTHDERHPQPCVEHDDVTGE